MQNSEYVKAMTTRVIETIKQLHHTVEAKLVLLYSLNVCKSYLALCVGKLLTKMVKYFCYKITPAVHFYNKNDLLFNLISLNYVN